MEKVGNRLREKILIVDDTRNQRTLAAEMLARQGYATAQADSAARALDMVSRESPDLLILDAVMPDLDGCDVVRRLKGDPFTRHIPIIMFTTDDATPERLQSLESGADDLLCKPFTPGDLAAHVQALLRRSVQYNPLTKLPAAPYLHRQIDTRLAQNQPTAVAYADLDHFRPYQQVYGQPAGDQVLLQTAKLLVESLPARNAFVGHLGADDFVAVLRPEAAETFAQTIVERFRALRDAFYSAEDLQRGRIPYETRGDARVSPLLTVSVAVVSNERRALINYVQVSDLLSEVMRFLKAQGGGTWGRDRRTY